MLTRAGNRPEINYFASGGGGVSPVFLAGAAAAGAAAAGAATAAPQQAGAGAAHVGAGAQQVGAGAQQAGAGAQAGAQVGAAAQTGWQQLCLTLRTFTRTVQVLHAATGAAQPQSLLRLNRPASAETLVQATNRVAAATVTNRRNIPDSSNNTRS